MIVEGYQEATHGLRALTPVQECLRELEERHAAAAHQKPQHQITKGFSLLGGLSADLPLSPAPGGRSRASSLLIQNLQSLFSSPPPHSFISSPPPLLSLSLVYTHTHTEVRNYPPNGRRRRGRTGVEEGAGHEGPPIRSVTLSR